MKCPEVLSPRSILVTVRTYSTKSGMKHGGTETESEPHDPFFSLCHVLVYAQISVADVGLHEKLIISLSGTYGDGMTFVQFLSSTKA